MRSFTIHTSEFLRSSYHRSSRQPASESVRCIVLGCLPGICHDPSDDSRSLCSSACTLFSLLVYVDFRVLCCCGLFPPPPLFRCEIILLTFRWQVVFGTIVTRGPRSALASNAMSELDQACLLFSKAAVHSRRAAKALVSVPFLRDVVIF